MTAIPCSCSPRLPALAAIACFAPVAVTFVAAPGVWWADYPGILFHLALFLLVPLLPAPNWARAAGYGWLVLDVTVAAMTLNGVPMAIALPIRYGGHIFAGLWIAAASVPGSLPLRLVGLITGAYLFGFTFVSPFLPKVALAPASLAMLVWLAVIAWQDGNGRAA